MEDSGAEYELMNCGILPQEVSEKNFSMLLEIAFVIFWWRMWLFIFFLVFVFGPCPNSLPETKEKGFGLISLAE